MNHRLVRLFVLFLLPVAVQTSFAWNYEGHHAVNELALSALPTNFPIALTPAVRERVTFLAGEPDRWRSTPDLELQHAQEPEHFLDVEELADCGLTPETLPLFRYDFVSLVAAARKEHPEKSTGGREDLAHKYCWLGLLPWAITENYSKLKSEFLYLKTFKAHGGTPDEIASAEANIIYTMGVMGHYVGDGSQPLHATKHHAGWVGENPNNYPTNSRIHSWIDGGYFRKLGGIKVETLVDKIHPAQHIGTNGQYEVFFHAVVDYLVADNKLVEPLYKLEKANKLSPSRDGSTTDPEGKAFMDGRLIVGAQMLGDIWFTAWQDANAMPDDKFLTDELAKRQAAKEAPKDSPTTNAPAAPVKKTE